MSCRCAIRFRNFHFIPRGQIRIEKRHFLFSVKFVLWTTLLYIFMNRQLILLDSLNKLNSLYPRNFVPDLNWLSDSGGYDFQKIFNIFFLCCYYLPLERRTIPFIWTKLISFYPRMFGVKFSWNWFWRRNHQCIFTIWLLSPFVLWCLWFHFSMAKTK